MNWATVALIIAQEGLPVAAAVVEKWNTGNPPTKADFEELRALASQSASDRVKARLVAAGIPLDSDKAKEILALVK